MKPFTFTLLAFFVIFLKSALAGEVQVAVAANFTSTLKEIAFSFEQTTGHVTLISSGSSGKFYAQILNGAPFDVFFSADVARPQQLEKDKFVVEGSRFTFAIGRLSLWSSDPVLLENEGPAILSKGTFKHLAIANPKTAPYGQAAQQSLVALGLWDRVKNRLVQGENIGQTFQFVFSKNAELGFVARSQILDPKNHEAGSRWDVPESLHDPLRQQAVLLMKGRNNEAAIAFLDYVKGQQARTIIKRYGYGLE